MKRAFVIGSKGTLGRAISHRLISDNYEIIGPAIEDLDLSKKESIDRFFSNLSKEEKFDFLTNTFANTLTFNKFESIPQEVFEEDMRINFSNFIYFLKKFLPHLRENSNIILILSEMVFDEEPRYFSPYVSSKYALLGLMKSLSGELKNKKIRINAVSPGMMETNFIQDLPTYMVKSYLSKHGKFVSPSDVAHKILEIIHDEKISNKNFGIFGNDK